MSRPTNPDAYWNRRESGRRLPVPAEVPMPTGSDLEVIEPEETPAELTYPLPEDLVPAGAVAVISDEAQGSRVTGTHDSGVLTPRVRLLDPIKAEAAEMERYRLASRRPITSLLPE